MEFLRRYRRRLFVFAALLAFYCAGYAAARGTHMLVYYDSCCGSAVGPGHLDKPGSPASAAAHVLDVTYWPLATFESSLRF